MVTDAQVRLMRQKRMDGKTLEVAAAGSGMSLRTAREWETGPVPSATKQCRDWRTRPDPFAAVWLTDVEPLLRSDRKGVLEAKWVLEVLRTRYPEQFHAGQARTLQRRFRDWRARHGVEPEVFFEQIAVAGREAAINFTHATDLGVTIAGDPFPHLLFEFVRSEEHTSELQSQFHIVCRLLLEKKNNKIARHLVWKIKHIAEVIERQDLRF